ncbi:suppressor of fused domain protein [Kineococcus sp. SYSU DK002]|uniref:suppressor of fused domain protein n=1 Tax=Kineococcus sp. SYSU DK002 TaxID=3383123 RepID=UPI003D7E9B57
MPEVPPPTDAEVRMARFVGEQLIPDGRPEIEEFLSRDESLSLDVLTAADAPSPGFTSVSTVSMHRYPNLVGSTDVRVELVTVLQDVERRLATGLLVASAFAAVGEPWPLSPGTVFPGIVADLLGGRTEHLLFTAPGNFAHLSRYPLEPGLDVHWLQAVPVHESERRFLLERGLDALEEAFVAAEVPFYDVQRDAVV